MMPLPLLSLFLASFALPLALSEADKPMLTWLIIGGLVALGPALHSWIKVFQFLKGTKEDTSQFVTKDELSAMKADRDKQISDTIARIEKDIEELSTETKTFLRDLQSIHHALGILKGHDEAAARPPRSRPR